MNKAFGFFWISLMVVLNVHPILVKGSIAKPDRHWFFGIGLNYNLPSGRLSYPAFINPTVDATHALVGGGFKHVPSYSFSTRLGYDRSINSKGIHGFCAALDYTNHKEEMDFQDYVLHYNGLLLTRQTDRFIFDNWDWELYLAYRLRWKRMTVQLGAMGLIYSTQVFKDYELNGFSSMVSHSYWWKLKRWYPTVQVGYHVLTKGNFRFDAFMAGGRRGVEAEEVNWWDIQVGVQVALVRFSTKRKR